MNKRKNKNKNKKIIDKNNMSKKKKLLSKIILVLLLFSFTIPGLMKIPEIFSNNDTKSVKKTILKAKINNILEHEAKLLMSEEKSIIIDVRTPEENKEKRFKNSILMPIQNLENYIATLGQFKDHKLIIYCRIGNRSLVASQLFSHYGFNNIYNLKDGIVNWKDKSYIESGDHIKN